MGILIPQIQEPVFNWVCNKIPPGILVTSQGGTPMPFCWAVSWFAPTKSVPGLGAQGLHPTENTGISVALGQLYAIGAIFIISILQTKELRF